MPRIANISEKFCAESNVSACVGPKFIIVPTKACFAKGAASVKLIEEEGGTRLFYEVDANVGGKLAQVGSRLIDGAARKIADGFFSKFAQRMVSK